MQRVMGVLSAGKEKSDARDVNAQSTYRIPEGYLCGMSSNYYSDHYSTTGDE